ncbi:MAG: DUF2071 domain-containing protein [Bdellovibrionales bacterium]|nr:DUF2071 domain-containing protein [Oligoflexia bacterium]
MEQEWNHVLFLHWQIDPALLQPHLPFELDLFEGKAVISIVPFQMNRIRFFMTPTIPFFSSLWELNLRTYVRVNSVPGVYFFTLDTDSKLGSFIANRFFHLPYRVAQMRASVVNREFLFESKRAELSLNLKTHLSGKPKTKTSLDHWATEREHLFTHFKDRVFQGTVIHDEWPLQEVDSLTLDDRFSTQLPIKLSSLPDEVAYCPHLKVRFRPFQRVTMNRQKE